MSYNPDRQPKKSTATPEQVNKERESVARVINILRDNFPIIDNIVETKRFSPEDQKGIDLQLILKADAQAKLGFRNFNIQVKSSLAGVEIFFEKGKQIKKEHRYNWVDARLIVLNGQADENVIISDFVSQAVNIVEVMGGDQLVADFFQLLDEGMIKIFEDVAYPEILDDESHTLLMNSIVHWVSSSY